eukprot:1156156-Pelagomonas_calceolata.AAC.1
MTHQQLWPAAHMLPTWHLRPCLPSSCRHGRQSRGQAGGGDGVLEGACRVCISRPALLPGALMVGIATIGG